MSGRSAMQVIPTRIPGCFEILPPVFRDGRGLFVKTFHVGLFAGYGLETRFVEEYYTVSRKGVLRGLHFQAPPREYVKLVHCLSGEVFDAVVDLRAGSPAYGKHQTFTLSARKANMVYIPPGLAHGFYVPRGKAILQYKVTSIHSPEHDTGILWNSAGISWPCVDPVLSERDRGFTPLGDYASPFRYADAGAKR